MMRAWLSIPFSLFICVFTLSTAEATFPEKTIAHWGLSVSKEVQDPDYEKVHDLAGKKEFAAALEIIDKKIAQFPRESTPLILKGFLLNEMGDYGRALDFLMEGSRIEQRHPAVHFGFCQAYRNLGVIELSQRGCQIAVDQHQNIPEARYEYAQTLAIQGKMEEAVRELKAAADLEPNNPQYLVELGLNSYYLNRVEDAETYFLKALSTDPENLDAAYEMAYINAAKGKTEAAKKYIYQILETRREHPKVNSAKLLLDSIDNNTAEKLPEKIIPHEYHLSRSKSFYQSGHYGLSLIEIQTAAALKPDDLKLQEILIGMASILFRLDAGEKAVNQLIELAGNNEPLKAKGYQELGDIRVIQGKLAEARQFYEKAKSFGDPGNLSQITLAQFPEDSASNPSLQNPQELFIKPTDALNRKGEIFAHYKMYDRAIALYSMVIRMDPNHLESMLNSAAAYYNNGKYGRAISILERIFVSHPNHENILAHRFLLAQAYAKNGDGAAALKNIQIVVKLDSTTKSRIASDAAFEGLKDNDTFKNLTQ